MNGRPDGTRGFRALVAARRAEPPRGAAGKLGRPAPVHRVRAVARDSESTLALPGIRGHRYLESGRHGLAGLVIDPGFGEPGFWSPLGVRGIPLPRRYPTEMGRRVLGLARAGTKVTQLAATFAIADATICNWLRQDRIDCGEVPGRITETALELAVARRRSQRLETELAVARKVNDVVLEQGISPNGSSRWSIHRSTTLRRQASRITHQNTWPAEGWVFW